MCVCVCVWVYVACVGECVHVYLYLYACVLHVRMCVSVWRARERTSYSVRFVLWTTLVEVDNRGELISKYRPTDTNLAQPPVRARY